MSVRPGPYRERISFAKLEPSVELPDLVEVQRRSYDWFLQLDVDPDKRKDQGLESVFREIFPIADTYEKNLILEYVGYSLGEPKYSEFECSERDQTYAAPLKIKVRLINRLTGEIREQDVYMGDIPLMTSRGTFIINGAERVIVNQIHRSPGVVFDHDEGKTHPAGKRLYSGKVLPYRGSWIEMEYEVGEILNVRLDRKRKIPVTTFLRVLGLETNEAILRHFYKPEVLKRAKVSLEKEHPWLGRVPMENIVDGETGEVIAYAGVPLDEKYVMDLEEAGVERIIVAGPALIRKREGEVEGEDETILVTLAEERKKMGKDRDNPVVTADEAVIRIYDLLRPGDSPPVETAREEIRRVFQDPRRYDLSDVGRYQLNRKLKMSGEESDERILRLEDVLAVIDKLIELNVEQGATDDTDHLANRRVRSVGELLQNQFRTGLMRMEKVIHQRMTTQDEDTMTPQELINIKPVTAIVKEFFGSSQLSQFMDQVNPLSELTHKRRLSALGPGGLKRERALSDVRDVHRTHYGRICPIETPEGGNIGLIVSLATHARVNEYGFIEAPYRRVKNGHVLDEVDWLTADAEDRYVVAQFSTEVDSKTRRFAVEKAFVRRRAEYYFEDPEKVDYMDVSPDMMVSVSTALIPFLEHDDANRALMGSNMQRQAVPLLCPEAPRIGTGMEFRAAYDSGAMVTALEEGEVVYVDAARILVKEPRRSTPREYRLFKFHQSNQSTCINQRPLVSVGDKVSRGQVLADGAATEKGELALGRNVVVAFMSWEGYNFEDAIIVSERLLKDDVYTSIHIESFEVEARDTKIGKEQITRDIPNVAEASLEHLDENGIVKVGSWVKPLDILVGKITPKGSGDLTPEHKLLYSIFGEKARDVRDTSLKVPHGVEGVVKEVKVFTRQAGDELNPGVEMKVKVLVANKRKLSVGDKMAGRHGNKGVVSIIVPEEDMPYLEDGTPVDIVLNPLGVPSRMNIGQILETHFGWAAHHLDLFISTPVFNGATENEVKFYLAEAGLPPDGKTVVYDGKTGDRIDQEVVVGVMYVLKLDHLVDDKMHARSTGPYSLVTQQPLGGKAQFGGQRLGEMEVWALEAYGAAYTLQELLTVKSDDVVGRSKIYEAIVKGENASPPGIPESFSVLVRELQGLALDVQVISEDGEIIELRETDETDLFSGMQAAMQRRKRSEK
ncbi:MAG: DNA-directed RNA polymerase subunit beta [Candidatus Hydrogenedentota bacterium]|nr:MAG: DNA-directed RNA polymerase subunit beta [Candidatus Hydrogenedentota bacterium]